MISSWFPALPPWDGIHPLVVQFPVALLLVAPLLALVGLLLKPYWRVLALGSLGLMVLGTLTLWLAAGSGHAAGQLVDRTPELARAIARHEALGTAARGLFTVLTLAYAALLLLPGWFRGAERTPVRAAVHVVFLALYVTCTGVLAHTADSGGHLVHAYGLRAMVERPDTLSTTPVADLPVTPAPAPAKGRLR